MRVSNLSKILPIVYYKVAISIKNDEIYIIEFATKNYRNFGESAHDYYYKKRKKPRLKHIRGVTFDSRRDHSYTHPWE
jgi:hypothetical protein